MRLALPFVALIVLAACDRSPEQPVPADAATTVPASEASVLPIASAAPQAPAKKTPRVTLAADGIIMAGAVDGRDTAATLKFGRDQAETLEAMTVEFGKPKFGKLAECGAGPMEFAAWGPLTLNFLGGKLVGWRAEKGAPVVTVDGLQLGNTLAEISAERSARRVPGTTLPGEFEYASGDGGTIGGFLDGAGDGAKVVSFHAGTTCFFR
ncbi:hypothetical protein [Novosphingobium sp. Gsoil 351]|uniref:hypothetical protein n=1 Tax=Novosphingobium sp. Gsoil 351 TaxID=2675225 RepID=UPI0012B445A0|nr:hypothetical protein [Novosphingobium sp. Gsoil 351]QGN56058.1 hypothetical protein GKE62_17395 [Novosphingobium sp. Gsoil 351]